jgi:magnesium transporter
MPDPIELILSIPEDERRTWMRTLAPDDAADLIQSASKRERSSLLNALDPWPRAEVAALLAHKEDEAGGVMNPRFAILRSEMTIDKAIAYLRRQAGQVETIYYSYVLDTDQKLIGVVSLRDLLSAPRTRLVQEVMKRGFQSVLETEQQQAVARLIADHRLLAIPVLDKAGVMQGIVTVDDAMQVAQEDANREIQKIGGSEALDRSYLETTWREMLKKRAGWLAVLFAGEMLTATAMAFFQEEIARAVVLALFIPLIISSGGNAGSQATTLVIRAMALGEVRPRQWWRVLSKEVVSGLGLGLVLCIIGVVRIVAWHRVSGAYGDQLARIALVVGCSLIGVVLFGTLAGAMLPLAFRTCRLDPATASAPAVATLVDVTGLVIYFSVARLFMLSGSA